MTERARQEYAEVMRARYQQADKAGKGRMPQPDADRSDEDDKARPSVDVSVVAVGPRIRNRVGGTDTVTAPHGLMTRPTKTRT